MNRNDPLMRRLARDVLGIHKIYGSWVRRIPGDHVFELAATSIFEAEEIRFVSDWLRAGDTFVDMGANFGLYTLAGAKAVGRAGKVVAVEPLRRNIRRLRWNQLLNLRFNIAVVRAAAGDREGATDFFECEQPAYSGFKATGAPAPVRAVRVQVTTLDAILERLRPGKVRLIKIDVEGFEWAALRGASKTLENDRPAILLEFSDVRTRPHGYSAGELGRWLEGKGYRLYRFAGGGKLAPLDLGQEAYDENVVAHPGEIPEPWRS